MKTALEEGVLAFQKGPMMVEQRGDSHLPRNSTGAGSAAEAASPARQMNSSKSDLLVRMSHEMRTPLSAILGFAQLMESATPSATISQKRSIERIIEAGWHLEKLINMTHDLALIDSGTMSLPLEPVALAAVMLDCQTKIETQARLRGVRVTFPEFETACSVSADRVRLQEVMVNLLSAAIEYTEVDGAVVVDCDTRNSEWIRIDINDGNEGSPVRQPTQSFQPFDEFEGNATRGDGTGIGLLLAKRLVELMGGAVSSEDVGGTRKVFSFDLKRMLVPMVAGPTATHSTLGEETVT